MAAALQQRQIQKRLEVFYEKHAADILDPESVDVAADDDDEPAPLPLSMDALRPVIEPGRRTACRDRPAPSDWARLRTGRSGTSWNARARRLPQREETRRSPLSLIAAVPPALRALLPAPYAVLNHLLDQNDPRLAQRPSWMCRLRWGGVLFLFLERYFGT